MSKAVFCMVNTSDHADMIVTHLKAAGFSENRISALLPDHKGNLDFAHKHNTKAPEGGIAGIGAGGLLGGSLGLIAGIGVLTIPGAGPFLAAGPIFSALSGAAVGAALGGIAGALVGMGIPEFEAKLYEGKVKAGSVLVAVQAKDGDEIRLAKDVFGEAGAHDIVTADAVTVRA